ncbi:MAG: hypothetical protein ACKVXR_00785 [Planctomycetota bacterium]
MDALALLCTLHADGPSTLKNLRQAGCESLQAIESMEEDRLSKVLGGPPAVARRFAREARQLRERLDPGLLDREETPSVPAPLEAADPSDAHREARRDPMADVLEAWRDRDAAEPPQSTDSSPSEPLDTHEDDVPPRAVRARPEFEFSSDIVAAMRDLATDIAPAEPIAKPLVGASAPEDLACLFEGQALELAVRLGDEGIADLRELTDEDVLDLSKRLGFGYTRILRVVQIARRALTPGAEPAAAAPAGNAVATATADARSIPKLSPAERPRNPQPSILELEWNLEIQPQAPPHERVSSDPTIPGARREEAGGPFA